MDAFAAATQRALPQASTTSGTTTTSSKSTEATSGCGYCLCSQARATASRIQKSLLTSQHTIKTSKE